jgi:hypothetical protein
MNKILIIICMFLTSTAIASENFRWKMSKDISEETGAKITLKSVDSLNDEQIKGIKNTFNDVKVRFFKYYHVSPTDCSFDPLEIRVVKNSTDLSNERYFPVSSEDRGYRIYGWYFPNSNELYITTPNGWTKWNRWFAHELLHYFFDDCGMADSAMGYKHNHEQIENFLDTYKTIFPSG